MVPSQQTMVDAFNYFVEQNPRVSVWYVANKFGIPYEQMRGALALHGECPDPMRMAKDPGEIRKSSQSWDRVGRPKHPALSPEMLEFVNTFIRTNGILALSAILDLSKHQVRKVAKGKVGLSSQNLAALVKLKDAFRG